MASKTMLRIGAAAGIVGLTGAAWFAGRQVRSPAQAAATANPPAASRITAPVEERELSSTVLIRGIVRYGEPRSVVLAASATKTTSSGAGATAIISTPAVKGAELPEGSVALSVGGRPVFVFEGKVPAYRDLRPGDLGDDVRQLESALLRLGLSPGAVDGRYDNATEFAVERWYVQKGYAAFRPTESQRTQLRTQRDTVSRAQDSVATAQRNLDIAKRSLSGDKLAASVEAVRVAGERVTTVQIDSVRDLARSDTDLIGRQSSIDLAERGVVLAEQSVRKAERDSVDTAPVADADDAVATANSLLRQAGVALDEATAQVPLFEAATVDARVNLDQAKKDLETTKRTFTTIPQPDVGAIVIQDNTGAIRAAEATVRQAETAIRQADANLVAAKRNVDSRTAAVADAERAVARAGVSVTRARQSVIDRSSGVADANQRSATAISDRDRAKRELATAQSARVETERASAVAARQAAGNLAVARAQLRDLQQSVDVKLSQGQVDSATQTRLRAVAELQELEKQVGTVVPANEMLFFPSLPLRVDEVRAQRGDVVNGPVMTVTTARLAVDSSVDVSEAKLVKAGAAVTIESTEFNVVLKGTVTEIAATAGTKGVDPGKVYLEVTPIEGAKTDVDAKDLNGSSVKLTIPIRSTGKAVLAVPVAAVSVAADGTSRVEVEDDPGRPTRFVTVRTGLSAEGYVEVLAVVGSVSEWLKAGDQVVVGNRDALTIEGSVEPNDKSSDTLAPLDSTAPSDLAGSPASADSGTFAESSASIDLTSSGPSEPS